MVGLREQLLLASTVLLLGAAVASNMPAQAPTQTVDLDQGWTAAQRESYYYTSQGTVIMPVSWMTALEGSDGKPFLSHDRMTKLGFIYDPSTGAQKTWPIGFAVDATGRTGPVPTVGLTCAACHTSEITYRGSTMIVEGGQANIDLDAFKRALNGAILATGADPVRRAAFEQRAIGLGFPKAAMASAFEAKYQALQASAPDLAAASARATVAGPGRNDALAAIALQLFKYALDVPSNENSATAPVDFPYLWDIPNLYWVQYNGSVRQPMSRNIGEALGVGATTQLIDPSTGDLAPIATRFKTSIAVQNLYDLEASLSSLRPPQWPTSVFGPIDRAKAARGEQLFGQHCEMCHGVRELAGPQTEWSVKVVPLTKIGTDPRQAENFANDTYDGTKLGLSKKATAGQGLLIVTNGMREQAYKDAGIPQAEWPKYDGFGRKNTLTTPCGYKARPLVGVWATPPFLHNGSVPTVFDLLSDTRPPTFRTGSVEYDPVHLGFVNASGPSAFTFDTSLVGNSNAGHWFADDGRPGRIGPKLTDADKYAIIEYLKIASFDTYPRKIVQHPDPEPCVDSATAYPAEHS